jgi:isopentenyldiphosphate isomerase
MQHVDVLDLLVKRRAECSKNPPASWSGGVLGRPRAVRFVDKVHYRPVAEHSEHNGELAERQQVFE